MCSVVSRLLLKFFIGSAIITVLIAFLPGLPPNIQLEPYTVTPSIDLAKLPRVNALDTAEVILQGQVHGTESIVAIGTGDGFYSGQENGQIIKYENGKVSVIARTGTDCAGPSEGHICGRPLGMRLDSSGNIVVADAYYGILRVNPKTGKIVPLFDYKSKIQGRAPLFADDLDISKDGTIYWSDVSTTTDYSTQVVEFLSDKPTGRLIKFDPKTKQNIVLIDGIHFANGVQLSKDEDFVLICETIRSRIFRYYLKGPKAGQQDIFMDGLPGLPDNIRSNGKGGFYIALIVNRQAFYETIAPLPIVRKVILRVRSLLLGTVSFIESFVSKNPLIEDMKQYVSKIGPIGNPPKSLIGPSRILEVDGTGQILRVLEHSKEQIKWATQMTISENSCAPLLPSCISNKC
ncbi:unnamed protein product [Allacma fusca]|uniref:Strictosidine synthase conserved region domain-containing protein n=1 Tax=Allacma fusca TaxID=39272 RepID=A0A8J2NZJ8_9HEXA|nr:unnamed protein product [Allacma fusca]